jgi:glycine oxidase
MLEKKNILIVGGGLAGCFIAAETALRGHQVTMIDQYSPKSASRVAAGLFNVVTGREASKTWMADEMLAAIHAFLAQPAFSGLGVHFHFMPIFRPFPDGCNYNDWMVKLQEPGYETLAKHVGAPQSPQVVANPIGGLRILTCGWTEVEPLCNAIKATLATKFGMQYYDLPFHYDQLDPVTGGVDSLPLQGTFDEVIFAEGMGILKNPWFPFVQIKPLKGQIMDIQMPPILNEEEILLKKTFLIPKGNHFYTIGSTYELHFDDDETTPEGIEILENSVREQVALPFERIATRASIRPTTPNRRPILGRHPDFPKLAVINGMGTKGVLHAPLMAKMLRDWLDGDLEALPKDVNLERFLKKKS